MNAPNAPRPLRVLVVDDSVLHRQTIAELLRGVEGVEVVGKAANGEEALRMAALVNPDLITLDLEMPRMDGFTFLRILMSRQPTPVIVISSQSHRENVFKALELGALDFVARPAGAPGDLQSVRDELLAKVNVVRALRPAARMVPIRPTTGTRIVPAVATPSSGAPAVTPTPTPVSALPSAPPGTLRVPRRLVVIASSTGGPQAMLDLAGRLPATSPLGVVIAQHMPERFTRTFAERLHRRAALRVAEAEDGAYAEAGTIWVCPGARATEVELEAASGVPRLRVLPVDASDRYVPSADRLFRTAAATVGTRVIAVVITGMGDDGAASLAAVKRAGGEVWVEAAESAVVDGMPAAARKTGYADVVLSLNGLVTKLSQI
jgi:two-component system chemotaxis response regulator CheB